MTTFKTRAVGQFILVGLLPTGLILWAVLLPWVGLAGFAQTTASPPYTIRMGDRQRTSIGFVYSPAVLAALVAQQPEEERPPLMVRAVAQGTPVVVMWSYPVPPEIASPPLPPWKIAVFPSGNRFGTDKIEPLWIEQDVAALGSFASNLHRPFIGAIAAFGQGALAPGRRVCLSLEWPPDYANKSHRSLDRCADLE